MKLFTSLHDTFRTAVLTGVAVLGLANIAAAQKTPKSERFVFDDKNIDTAEWKAQEPFNWEIRQPMALTNEGISKVYNGWLNALDSLGIQDSSVTMKANIINTLVNASIVYMTDKEMYNLPEYYAPPAQSIAYGRGDCEDFAIAKYDALLHLGVPENRLMFLLVAHNKMMSHIDHCVLAVDTSAANNWTNPLVLDINRPTLRVAPTEDGSFAPVVAKPSQTFTFKERHYKPFYAFDASKIYNFRVEKVKAPKVKKSGLKP